jgi:Zn-dependent protease
MMIKPAFLEPEDRPAVVGHAFGTPIVVKGWTGLPLIELVVWGILSWLAGHKRPDWSRQKQAYAGAVTTIIMLGSEWCHNLAHTAIASRIGKPVDAVRIFWGTPLLIYYDINDHEVIPRQHILRALGGPVFNALMVPLAGFAKHFSREASLTRYAADFALGTNAFISSLSLLPIPGIDGGPLLKWLLVEGGHSPEQADEVVKGVNRFLGGGLAVASGVALKKRRVWIGAALAAFAATSLAIGFGYLKEHK